MQSRILMPKLERLYLLLKKIVADYLYGIKLWNNLYSSSFPLLHLWKILKKNFKPLFLVESTYFTIFSLSTLTQQMSHYINSQNLHWKCLLTRVLNILHPKVGVQIGHVYFSLKPSRANTLSLPGPRGQLELLHIEPRDCLDFYPHENWWQNQTIFDLLWSWSVVQISRPRDNHLIF